MWEPVIYQQGAAKVVGGYLAGVILISNLDLQSSRDLRI